MSKDFDPMDLDEDFIDDIYKEAVTDDKHDSTAIEVLGPDLVKNRSGIIHIVPRTILEYSEYIDYMFGQIRAFHDQSINYVSFDEGFVNYMNNYWTRDMQTMMKLYALGIANHSISPFVKSKKGNILATKSPLVIPTLNTEDPEFDDWFEKVYKKKYVRDMRMPRDPNDDFFVNK